MSERLLMPATGKVYRESCPTLAHYIDGISTEVG